MNDLIETRTKPSESIQEARVARAPAVGGTEMPNALMNVLASQPRKAPSPWCSSLSAVDLDCLLRVLETDLIPQLLTGYSPAGSAPGRKPPSST